MNLIVAVDKNWAIGKNGNLLVHIPEDMKFFKEKTLNNVVIMGRKTLESFPGQKPLKDRINIVITNDKAYKKDGVLVVHSIRDAITEANKYNKEIFVIGGASIYRQMLHFCDTAYITKIDIFSTEADAFFPNIDKFENWKMEESSSIKEYKGLKYQFTIYKKNMQMD